MYPFHAQSCADFAVQRVEKIFKSMNKDKDSKITYSEFVECSKQDPTVMDVRISAIVPCTLLHSHTATGTLTLRWPCIARPHRSSDALQPLLFPSDVYHTLDPMPGARVVLSQSLLSLTLLLRHPYLHCNRRLTVEVRPAVLQ